MMTPTHFGILLVLSATALEGFGQVLLKKAALVRSGKGSWRGLGLMFFALEALVYTWSLRYLDVSTAFPLSSLSFAAVAFLSRGLLRETVDRTRWVGVLLILAGASLVALRA
ncbi:MAG: EamA family transporter [Humidesulfovibrio sp.]|nr:EamA family transporter [Humidesulfovibrio sp.]